jgi:hypothetical protein
MFCFLTKQKVLQLIHQSDTAICNAFAGSGAMRQACPTRHLYSEFLNYFRISVPLQLL